MSKWSLSALLAGLHEDIESQLAIARKAFVHPGTKGDATEAVWLKLLHQFIIPAESVYSVFEAKQSINATMVTYAQEKIASVRQLHRTSLPIPHAGGTYPPKPLTPILGGILTLGSDWSPPLGDAMITALLGCDAGGKLNLGCVASHGVF